MAARSPRTSMTHGRRLSATKAEPIEEKPRKGSGGGGRFYNVVRQAAREAREDREREKARLEEAERFNFHVNGKHLRFARRSLYMPFLVETHPIRKFFVWLVTHPLFELVVLLLILANSVVLALTNYNAVTSSGELDTSDPLNAAVDNSELVFTTFFGVEMCLKMLAMGVIVEEGSYLRDSWNVLDFVVVVAGLLAILPEMPNISAFRTVRVLRPLRSLNAVPGMRLLVQSLLRSIPPLLNVVALLSFIFVIFGVLGLQLWSGILSRRCRLTEYPVTINAGYFNSSESIPLGPNKECSDPLSTDCLTLFTIPGTEFYASYVDVVDELEELAGLNTSASSIDTLLTKLNESETPDAGTLYRSYLDSQLGIRVAGVVNSQALAPCIGSRGDSNIRHSDDEDWTQDTSPWIEPKTCFWPSDPADTRACSYNDAGDYTCPDGRWCGSDYDEYGNDRFLGYLAMHAATFIPDRNFGFMTFDNIGASFATIFQCITMEGWVDIMYMIMDSYNGPVASIYFVILIVVGSFFLLNLTLAVIWESFSTGQRELEEEQRLKAEELARKRRRENAAELERAETEAEEQSQRSRSQRSQQHTGEEDGTGRTVSNPSMGGVSRRMLDLAGRFRGRGPDAAPNLSSKDLDTSDTNEADAEDENHSDQGAGVIHNSNRNPAIVSGAAPLNGGSNHSSGRGMAAGREEKADGGRAGSVGTSNTGSISNTNNITNPSDRPLRHPEDDELSMDALSQLPESNPHHHSHNKSNSSRSSKHRREAPSSPTPGARAGNVSAVTVTPSGVTTDTRTPGRNADGTEVRRTKSGFAADRDGDRDGEDLRPTPKATANTNLPPPPPPAPRLRSDVPRSNADDRDHSERSPSSNNNDNNKANVPVHRPLCGRARVAPSGGSAAGSGSGTASSYPSGGVTSHMKRFPASFIERHIIMEQVPGWRRPLYRVVKNPWFAPLVLFFIVLNTIILAIDRYPIDDEESEVLEAMNVILTLLFAVEMIVKIWGLGLREYLGDSFNVFDACIVTATLIELIVAPPTLLVQSDQYEGASGGAISALRTFRLFRVFTLARQWRSLRVLLETIAETLSDVAYFAVLLVLFMYIFALVGMQFFANRFCFDPDTGLRSDVGRTTGSCPPPLENPRANFDSILWAFVTVFQILTGENWNTVQYDGIRATDWPAFFYFIILFILGNFVVLNLFLAILLGNFEAMEEATGPEDEAYLSSEEQRRLDKLNELRAQGRVPADMAHPEPPTPGARLLGPLQSHEGPPHPEGAPPYVIRLRTLPPPELVTPDVEDLTSPGAAMRSVNNAINGLLRSALHSNISLVSDDAIKAEDEAAEGAAVRPSSPEGEVVDVEDDNLDEGGAGSYHRETVTSDGRPRSGGSFITEGGTRRTKPMHRVHSRWGALVNEPEPEQYQDRGDGDADYASDAHSHTHTHTHTHTTVVPTETPEDTRATNAQDDDFFGTGAGADANNNNNNNNNNNDTQLGEESAKEDEESGGAGTAHLPGTATSPDSKSTATKSDVRITSSTTANGNGGDHMPSGGVAPPPPPPPPIPSRNASMSGRSRLPPLRLEPVKSQGTVGSGGKGSRSSIDTSGVPGIAPTYSEPLGGGIPSDARDFAANVSRTQSASSAHNNGAAQATDSVLDPSSTPNDVDPSSSSKPAMLAAPIVRAAPPSGPAGVARRGKDGDEEEELESSLSMSRMSSMSSAGDSVGSEQRSVERKLGIRRRFSIHGRSMCLWHHRNPYRRRLARFVQSQRFDYVIISLIVISAILLAVDSPLLNPDSDLVRALFALDIVFTVLFTIEASLKIAAFGFLLHRNAYLRSGWNILDFVIVVISILSLAATFGGTGSPALRALRSLRALRALRPLRVVSRLETMQVVVNALFSSLAAILNVVFICVLFFLIFGIVGVSYFKGSFSACSGTLFDEAASVPEGSPDIDPRVLLVTDPLPWSRVETSTREFFTPDDASTYRSDYFHTAPTSKVVCELLASSGAAFAANLSSMAEVILSNSSAAVTNSGSREALISSVASMALGARSLDFAWEATVPSSFDNIILGTLALFEMSTTEGWVDIMYAGIDARGIEMQPKRNANPGWVVYFIAFMVVGSLFVTNLFVGVVIEHFNRMRERLGDGLFLTPEQREWQRTYKRMMLFRPERPPPPTKNPWARAVQAMVTDARFEPVIMGCIVANTIVMAMIFWGMPQAYSDALDIVNYIFAAIFTLEAILKILAFGFRGYIRDSWNKFDFLVVLGTDIGIIISLTTDVTIGPLATVVRTFRVGRVFRLAKRARMLKRLFETFLMTLPQFVNIGLLLLLLLFIYSILGVQLFSTVAWGDAVNAQANFQTFGSAMLMLMRFSTGEAWNSVMYELATAQEGCVADYSAVPQSEREKICGFQGSTSNDPPLCEPPNGCGTGAAYPFFSTFTLVVTFIFLNLFIAVILERFDMSSEEESDSAGDSSSLSDEHLEHLKEKWLLFDPEATLHINADQLVDLLRTLRPPLGFADDSDAPETHLLLRAAHLNVPMRPGRRVHFADVSEALAKRVFEVRAKKEGRIFEIPENRKLRKRWEETFGTSDVIMGDSAKDVDFLNNYYAARIIERMLERALFRRRMRKATAEHKRMTQAAAAARKQLEEEEKAAAANNNNNTNNTSASASASATVNKEIELPPITK